MTHDIAKRAAALAALDLVRPGMTLGLGTGSTAELFLAALGARVKAGLDVRGVPTSMRTERRAEELGIALVAPGDVDGLDLSVDGADEIDPQGRLIKGGGGALLREKLVAEDSRRRVIIADESKFVTRLGHFPLPVEIVGFGARRTLARLRKVLAEHGTSPERARLRVDDFGEPFVTDSGNVIVDAPMGPITDADALAGALKAVTGVVEHGLFIGLTDLVILGRSDGTTITPGLAPAPR